MTDDTPRTIEIPLPKGDIMLVDEIDADLVDFKWHATSSNPKTTYVCRYTHPNGRKNRAKVILAHRVILGRMLGRELTKQETVDHVNGDGRDNRRLNLRLATPSQNSANARISSNNKSGYKGVSWNSKTQKWAAVIRYENKYHFLGYFDDPAVAHEAYKAAAVKIHGEFANFGGFKLRAKGAITPTEVKAIQGLLSEGVSIEEIAQRCGLRIVDIWKAIHPD